MAVQVPIAAQSAASGTAAHSRQSAQTNLANAVAASIALSEALVTSVRMLHDVTRLSEESRATASEMIDLTTSLRKTTGNSRQAAAVAVKTEEAAQQSLATLNQAAAAMQSIVVAVQQTAAQIEAMQQAASGVGDILRAVDAIARQSHLLAINAAIEAAHVGDAGRGFAVVAAEVKALAAQTSAASQQISDRMQRLNDGTASITKAMEAASLAVAGGQTVIDRLHTEMSTAGTKVGEVAHHIHDTVSALSDDEAAAGIAGGKSSHAAGLAAKNEHEIVEVIDALERAAEVVYARVNEFVDLSSSLSLVQVAKSDHLAFKKRLTDALMGRQTWRSVDVPDEHSCRLGKWYDNVKDPAVVEQEAFRDLQRPHVELHLAARAALAANEHGDAKGALLGLNRFDVAASQVVDLLTEISDALIELDAKR
jgi:methyl-accepting chemotaxis protein